MEPESKPKESELIAPPKIVCTSARYPECTAIKRTPLKTDIDPEVLESFFYNYDLLPLVEAKIHDYIDMKHLSLETNDLLKCRWKAFKECAGKRVRGPFQFPNADDHHFHNFLTRYIPSHKNKDHRRRLTHDHRFDQRGIGLYLTNRIFEINKPVKP